MLTWQSVAGTSAGRLVGFLNSKIGKHMIEKEAANLLCMQKMCLFFLWLQEPLAVFSSGYTTPTWTIVLVFSETTEAFRNSRKNQVALPSARVRKLCKHLGWSPGSWNWFNQIQWGLCRNVCLGEEACLSGPLGTIQKAALPFGVFVLSCGTYR